MISVDTKSMSLFINPPEPSNADEPPDRRTPLYQSVRALDHRLAHPELRWNGSELPNLETLQRALKDVSDFHQQIFPEPLPLLLDNTEFHPLIAVGCRLSADLSESVMGRLWDGLHAQESAIAALSAEMKALLRNHAQLRRLFDEAQALQQQTQATAHEIGLGTIL